MRELVAARRDVPLNHVKVTGGLANRPLEFENDAYILKHLDKLSTDAIDLLLEIHPIFVVAKQRRFYVVSGYRTFQAAALVYKNPHQEIPVEVLDRRTPPELLELLCYLDLSVTPVLFRIDGSLADGYQLITNRLQNQAWEIKSIHAFAEALGVAPSTLCKPNKRSSSQKPLPAPKDSAFSNAVTLKLAYLFLLLPDYAEHAHTTLAAITGTSLEEIRLAMEELESAGFIVKATDNRQYLANRKKLLELWVGAYHEYLRPKLLLGRFTAADKDWWLNAKLESSIAKWSGEVAARKLAESFSGDENFVRTAQFQALTAYYSQPIESAIIYSSRENLASIIQENMLKQDPHGNIEIFERFWSGNELDTTGDTVALLLIYADLSASNRSAKKKLAREIYSQFVEQQLERL